MLHQTISASLDRSPGTHGARLALALAAAVLLGGVISHLSSAVAAIRFPYELDYGEGIVWQQMRLIVAGKGYAPIDAFPAIVFHYPPVYHLLTAALAGATGMDELAAGRALSVTGTVVAAGFVGLIARHLVRFGAGAAASSICGLIAGAIVFSMAPVVQWSTLMRVDMVALALTFAGVYFGLRALNRPGFVIAASLCFVAAVYTKQSAVAAPAAVFATLLFVRPRTALAGIATAIVVGLTVLAFLHVATDGGFVRHIFLYNLNRLDPSRLGGVAAAWGVKALYLVVAGFGVVRYLRSRATFHGGGGFEQIRRRMTASPADSAFSMVLVHALFSTLTLVMVAKSGSNINYMLEWACVLAILVGAALREAAKAATDPSPGASSTRSPIMICLLPLVVASQAMLLPTARDNGAIVLPARQVEFDMLVQLVSEAPQPVVSDDMVVVLRGGKPVVWEPAIFAELASTGLWNEAPFVRRIETGEFAFFITAGGAGEHPFINRYNPAVARAIAAAYPVKRRLAGFNLHFPAADQKRRAIPGR